MSDDFLNCFTILQQEFLVCITVHKARNLSVYNADTYVKVTLDKKVKQTKVYQNSENPYFNEYFVFEVFCSLNELLRLTILFQVFRHNLFRKDVLLGELFLDLATIWNQSGHSFFKKWGKLESPMGQQSGKSRGHLQVDLSIVTKNEPPAPAVFESHDYDDIEKLSRNIP
ncbi:unnamed protein product [Hermetia illucens]|uniref:C2 domain-containing protein n=1 Tax=Hermetia illucens TaxID=343691 RepID=A0A7R8YTU3_HERIL|nr:unnamed protein product [Hermetia illucens]